MTDEFRPPPPGFFVYRGQVRERRAGRLRDGQTPRCADRHKMPIRMLLHAGRGGYSCEESVSRDGCIQRCNAMLYVLVSRGRRYAADITYDDVKYMERERMDTLAVCAYLGVSDRTFPEAHDEHGVDAPVLRRRPRAS